MTRFFFYVLDTSSPGNFVAHTNSSGQVQIVVGNFVIDKIWLRPVVGRPLRFIARPARQRAEQKVVDASAKIPAVISVLCRGWVIVAWVGRPYVNVIQKFVSLSLNRPIKLECLSLEGFHSLVLCLWVRQWAITALLANISLSCKGFHWKTP
jgi:hypothetical protein